MAATSISIWVVLSAYFLATLCLFFPDPTTALNDGEDEGGSIPLPVPARHGALVKKDQRWNVATTEFGEISAVKVSDGRDGFYHLQFITMEPNSLFLPVHLHSDMVFYVNSGSGTLNWVDLEKDDDKLRQLELKTGDVFRLRTGSFFYLQSNLDSDRRKLRIHAIFSDSREEIREGSSFGAYASVRDLLLGFDNRVLQAALNVDEKVIGELRSGGKQGMIVHGVAKSKANEMWEVHYRIMRAFLGHMKNDIIDINKSNKDKAYNILTADHDVENCNGWSLVVTSKQSDVFKDSDFSIFMVNLTKGAMMGPHWNPTTVEIGLVVEGRGMVHVVCPSTTNETECRNSRFRVEEGDVFVVPRYHPMAQMSFNNGSFVFMGFTTTTKKNHPQYLVGTASVFQVLDKMVVAASFGVSNTTMDQVLSAQRQAIILECTSCAEEEERVMEEEIERAKEEEVRRREEEEAKRKEEEEAKKREEEEARRKEEEAAKQRQEEEASRRQEEEAARRKQEEEAAKRRQEEEEEAKRQEEEAARQKQEEEAKRRQEEEEAARRQQEEEAKRQQEEEKAEAAAKKQEEEEARQREEEAARKQEEEAGRRRQEEEEAARRQEEEAARRQQEQQEEAARRQDEEAARRQQEQQEEAARRQHREEEAKRRHEEEEAARGGGGGGGGGHQGQGEGEAASREEEEMARREREAEAAARGRGGGQRNGHYEE